MSKLIVYSLDGCPYSRNTENELRDKDNVEIIKVYQSNKSEIKQKNNMYTFPQIFFKCKENLIKIGGNDDLMHILSIIKKGKNKKSLDFMVEKLDNKLDCSKKELLKLIDLLK